MNLTRLRFCEEADNRLRHLKARTTLTPNLLCRIGFCLSLADPTLADPARYPEDSTREIGRYTLTGPYDALFLALLRERCARDGLPTEGEAFEEQFRAHMNRGVLLLYHRVKSLVDLCRLVEATPLAAASAVGLAAQGAMLPAHVPAGVTQEGEPRDLALPAPALPSADGAIYMDHHATTPVEPRVLQAMLPFFAEEFGNAASKDHEFGARANRAVEQARAQVAELLRARPDEIIFTSGATEADNLALLGVAERYRERGNHLITCVTEHKAVLDAAHHLEGRGWRVTYLGVDGHGRVELDALRRAITPQTVLVSIMAANNEIGTLAPLAEIGAITREHGVLFHTDATQAVGHIPLDVQAMQIDLLSLSAHKFYGPKGVGALYVRRSNPGVRLAPILHGGGHERGLRSGTLNVPSIVGMGEAAAIARREMRAQAVLTRRWTERMWAAFEAALGPIERNGHPTERLPHNLNVYLPGIESRSFITGLGALAISTGSACTTTSVEPSHVIRALGCGDQRAHSSLRFGLGRSNSDEQVERAIELVIERVRTLRALGTVVES